MINDFQCLTTKREKLKYAGIALAQGVHRFWPHHYSQSQWVFMEYIRGQDNIDVMSVAMQNEKMIGWAIKLEAKETKEIHVFVVEEHRRQGIGTNLLKLIGFDKNYIYDFSSAPEFWSKAA